MHVWFLIQTLCHELKRTSRKHLDAAAGGAFFSLQIPVAKELIKKMVSNQGWDGDRLQPRTRGVHQVDGIDMIAARMDLMKKLEASSNMETAKIMVAHMICEVCGNVVHLAMIVLRQGKKPASSTMATTASSATTTTTIKGGGKYSNFFNNQPSIKDLVFGQARTNESLKKNLAANEKVLENHNSTIESFTYAMKNQLSFTKMIENQLA
jgi:hypothetical protein